MRGTPPGCGCGWTRPARPASPSSWRSRRDVRRASLSPDYPYDRLDDGQEAAARCPGAWWTCRSAPRPIRRRRPRSSPGRAARSGRTNRGGARLPALDRDHRAAPGHSALGKGHASVRRSPSTPWPSAWAPRSSWPACRSGSSSATPSRDTVLYPAVSYPTYEMGALLAGLRAVPVPVDERVAARPRGGRPGRRRAGVAAVGQHARQPGRRPRRPGRRWRGGAGSTACRFSATSATPSSPGTGRRGPSSVTAADRKGSTGWWRSTRCRSAPTWPGMRVGWYSGDRELVEYLREVRKHAGFMVPGPVQQLAAAVAARGRSATSRPQRARYWERLVRAREILAGLGVDCDLARRRVLPVGAGARRRRLGLDRWLAERGGAARVARLVLRSPGRGYVRLAMVAPIDAWTWWRSASGSTRCPRSGSQKTSTSWPSRSRPPARARSGSATRRLRWLRSTAHSPRSGRPARVASWAMADLESQIRELWEQATAGPVGHRGRRGGRSTPPSTCWTGARPGWPSSAPTASR